MILLTGATGFIGTHLLDCLAKKYGKQNIVILSSRIIDGYKVILHNDYRFDSGIWAKNGIEYFDIVIHAGAFIPKSATNTNNWINNSMNITNTMTLLSSLKSCGKFIFLSTVDVYENSDYLINEDSIVSPSTLYGQSKLYCERMIESWSMETGVIIQNLRIGHIYGPGEQAFSKIIPLTMKNVLQRKPPIIISDGQEKRSFLFVKDCCNYILKTLSLDEYVGPVNVVSKQVVTIFDLVSMIVKVSGSNVEPIILNQNVATKNYCFDNSKLYSLFGKIEIPLEEGLSIEWAEFSSSD